MPVALHKVIEDIESLSLEDKEYVKDVIQKIIIEARREDIRLTGEEAMKDYQEGKARKGSAKELLDDLND